MNISPDAAVTRRILLAAVTLSAVVGVLVGSLTSWVVVHRSDTTPQVNTQPVFAGGNARSVGDIAAARAPSLVSIAAHPVTADDIAAGTAHLATGLIASADGLVVTSAHAVAGATQLRVATSDGHAYDATLVATDTTHGIAILRLPGAHDLTPVVFAATAARAGDLAILVARGTDGDVVGAGTFRSTVTTATVGGVVIGSALRTDLGAEPGDDGGALLDGTGAVVGVAVADDSDFALMAASGADAQALVASLAAQSAPPSRLDVVTMLLDPGVAGLAALPAGALVVAVDPAGPAHVAGIQVGDVITAVNGTAVDANHGVDSVVAPLRDGAVVSLAVTRHGQALTVSVTASAH